MKREGRQHGMVRVYTIHRPELSRLTVPWFNQVHQTAGGFARVPNKPTNHSKFTGKFGDLPQPSTSKSLHNHKAKRAHKLRSQDVVNNTRLVAWRVVDARQGSNFAGVSATAMLRQLARGGDEGEEDYYDDGDEVEDESSEDADYGLDGLKMEMGSQINDAGGVAHDEEENNGDAVDGDDEEKMSYCEVGYGIELEEGGDEGWCLIEDLSH